MNRNTLLSVIFAMTENTAGPPRLLASLARQSEGRSRTEVVAVSPTAFPRFTSSLWQEISGSRNVTLVETERTASVTEQLNLGGMQASSQYLLFLAPETRLDPKFLTSILTVFDENPKTDAVYSDYIRLVRDASSAESGFVQLPGFSVSALQSRNILGPAVCYRRTVWDQDIRFRANTTYHEWDYHVQATLTGASFFHIPYPLVTAEQGKPSFKARAEDGRSKALLVINNQSFFHPHTVRWALCHLRGETWATQHALGVIPGPLDVTRQFNDHILHRIGAHRTTQNAIRQFESSVAHL